MFRDQSYKKTIQSLLFKPTLSLFNLTAYGEVFADESFFKIVW